MQETRKEKLLLYSLSGAISLEFVDPTGGQESMNFFILIHLRIPLNQEYITTENVVRASL